MRRFRAIFWMTMAVLPPRRGSAGAAWLLVGALVMAMTSWAHAGQTPPQKCSVAKNKAAAKKIGAKLKCHQKAISLSAPVDPACLTAAETKFAAAIAKAESAGGCAVNGDGATLEAAVDACVTSILGLTPVTTTTSTSTTTTTVATLCCSGVPLPGFGYCAMTLQAGCIDFGTSPQTGVCRNDGTCGAATPAGDCCQFPGGKCWVFQDSALDSIFCQQEGGTHMTNKTCTAAGCQ